MYFLENFLIIDIKEICIISSYSNLILTVIFYYYSTIERNILQTKIYYEVFLELMNYIFRIFGALSWSVILWDKYGKNFKGHKHI